MDIKTNTVQGKKIGIFIPHGLNRNADFYDYCAAVWKKFNIEVNFIGCDFPNGSHGYYLNRIMQSTIDADIDFYILSEIDCIPLVSNILELVYDKIKDGNSIFSHCQQSNHKIKSHGNMSRPYASPGFLCFSKELYLRLNRPTLDHTDTCDTAENFTEQCERKGAIVCLMWPKSVYLKNCEVCDVFFGMGNEFELCYHAMQQNNPMSSELFKDRCNQILNP